MNETEIIRSATTLATVLFGFLLGQISEWVKNKRKSKFKSASIRKIISLEKKHNTALLKNYYDAIISSAKEWETESKEFRYVQFVEQAARTPFPTLTTEAWQANLGEVTSVYKENELEQFWEFHIQLKALTSMHDFFCEAKQQRHETTRFHESKNGPGIGGIIGGLGFSETVREPAKEFHRTLLSVIKPCEGHV